MDVNHTSISTKPRTLRVQNVEVPERVRIALLDCDGVTVTKTDPINFAATRLVLARRGLENR